MSRWSQRNRPMADYQMVEYAKDMILDVNTIYEDVKLSIDAWLPVVTMIEGRYIGMSAIRVLENLLEDIDWDDFEDDEE